MWGQKNRKYTQFYLTHPVFTTHCVLANTKAYGLDMCVTLIGKKVESKKLTVVSQALPIYFALSILFENSIYL